MPVPFPRYWILHNGWRMPNLGLGTYQSKGDKVKQAVDCALSVGYRHIDTARLYDNERDIGDALRDRLNSGSLKRKDLFITTKIPPAHLDEKDVRPSLKASLEELQLTYVDMLLIHWPFGMRNHGDGNMRPLNDAGEYDFYHHDLRRTWKAMEYLVKEGKVRSLGLSNCNVKQINKIWYNASVKPSNLQLECHVYNQQKELLHYCEARDILVTGYCPLGSPNIPEHHRIGRELPNLLTDPVITTIAKSIKRTNAQVLLRFLQQMNVAPLPKSENPQRIEENYHVYNFALEWHEMQQIFDLNKNLKYFTFDFAKSHPEYYEDESF